MKGLKRGFIALLGPKIDLQPGVLRRSWVEPATTVPVHRELLQAQGLSQDQATCKVGGKYVLPTHVLAPLTLSSLVHVCTEKTMVWTYTVIVAGEGWRSSVDGCWSSGIGIPWRIHGIHAALFHTLQKFKVQVKGLPRVRDTSGDTLAENPPSRYWCWSNQKAHPSLFHTQLSSLGCTASRRCPPSFPSTRTRTSSRIESGKHLRLKGESNQGFHLVAVLHMKLFLLCPWFWSTEAQHGHFAQFLLD